MIEEFVEPRLEVRKIRIVGCFLFVARPEERIVVNSRAEWVLVARLEKRIVVNSRAEWVSVARPEERIVVNSRAE